MKPTLLITGLLLSSSLAYAQTATLRVETNETIQAGINPHWGNVAHGRVKPVSMLLTMESSRFTTDVSPFSPEFLPIPAEGEAGEMGGNNVNGYINYITGSYYLYPAEGMPWVGSTTGVVARYYSYDYSDVDIVHYEPLEREPAFVGFHLGRLNRSPLVAGSVWVVVDNELFMEEMLDGEFAGGLVGTEGGRGIINYVTGDWLVAPTNFDAASVIAATYAVDKAGQDAYEPDDSFIDAKTISNGQTQNRTIDEVGNADWVKFVINGAGAQNLMLETAGPGGDTEMWLYGPDDAVTEVAYDDNSGTGSFSRIMVPALVPGTYYLKIQENGNNATIPAYALSANWTGLFVPDAYEPDDSMVTAQTITNGETQTRNIHLPGNKDWAQFTVDGNWAQNLTIGVVATGGDMQLGLYRADGDPVAANENISTGGLARIVVAALEPGTYYAEIQESGNNGTIPAYTLAANWVTGYNPDAYEPDDSPGAAKIIANGEVQARNIHAAGNVDFAYFEIPAAGARFVVLETAGDTGDTEMWVTGPDGFMAHDDNSGTGSFSRIAMIALVPGTYLIEVQEKGNNGTIPAYTLKTEWVTAYSPDAYEPDNTAATASLIANGEIQINRNIHEPGNVDWVAFTVGNTKAQNVVLETAGGTGDTEMWLYGPDSAVTEVAYDDNSGTGSFSRIEVPLLMPGIYYLKIQEKDNNGTIPAYALLAYWTTMYAPDAYEPDDSALEAQPIINGQVQDHNIHAVGDTDWAKFVIGSAGAKDVRVETVGVGPGTKIWIFKGESLLAYDDDSGMEEFSFVWFAALGPGTYHVKIQEENNWDTLPAYTLKVSWPAASGDLLINPSSMNLPVAATGGRQIAVTANLAWSALANQSWIIITDGNAGVGNGNVTFGVTANSGTSARTGTILVTGGGITRTCTVVQAGAVGGSPAQRINCGGGALTGGWVADTGFSGGGVGTTASSVANATLAPMALYQTDRNGTSFRYNLAAVPNGTYQVRLHFCEMLARASGQRVFHVAAEGGRVLSNLDVYAAAGGRLRALARTFTVTIADGNGLQLDFTRVVGYAQVCGIEVESLGPPPPAVVASPAAVTVPEGGTTAFGVHLNTAPADSTTVTVTRASGDSDIGVSSGASLVFTPANYGTDQTVTLAAGEDGDTAHGTATIQCTAPGYAAAAVTATEQDNDVPPYPGKINCGGGVLTGGWAADTGFSGGAAGATASSVANATLAPMALYQTDRNGISFRYSLATVPNGTYQVRLHFCEMLARGSGQRVFHVAAEGVRMLSNLDVYAAAGGRLRALVRTFNVTVTDGNGLQLDFTRVLGYAQVSGIEITPAGVRRSAAKAIVGHALAESLLPDVVLTSEDRRTPDAGWTAADGDLATAWRATGGWGGWICLGYARPVSVNQVKVNFTDGSPQGYIALSSLDAQDWYELEAELENGPVNMNYLWLLFPATPWESPPEVIEILIIGQEDL